MFTRSCMRGVCPKCNKPEVICYVTAAPDWYCMEWCAWCADQVSNEVVDAPTRLSLITAVMLARERTRESNSLTLSNLVKELKTLPSSTLKEIGDALLARCPRAPLTT